MLKKDNWFYKKRKYLITIFLYLAYQSSFLLALLTTYGFKYSSLSKTGKMIYLYTEGLIYIIAILFMYRKEIKEGLKDLKEHFVDRGLISVLCWFAGAITMAITSYIITAITKQDVSSNEQIVRENIKLAPIYMLFSCAIVAPILEEFVFRISTKGLIKNNKLYIIISSLLFGLIHVIGSYKTPLDFLFIIPYSSMGIAFSYLYTKTKNPTLSVFVHMIHNIILVLIQIIGLR